mmetsp:Transcript_32530/g.68397  ORF Transcript_32530/g.68397 Transcript_32530/m.68397 type:complete len:301 (-) Transcript_32530:53-955(-)|eukprot:CAMPEP_0172327246 /NCGR_PEP_ID=MMETSP1058-20130122/59032_1 /TAXON_ID=83371 /ORGANISM="Detonula confervacea, Strain CCMP 353" /LENGTH=300 /DNA_ID=CAMNT_0013044245 /DNA_START=81 /DNA_END=983 /DNA_ORIENTATION=-
MLSPETLAAPPSLSPIDDVHAFWAQRWSGPKLGWHKDDVNPHLQKYTNLLFGSEDNLAADEGTRIFVPLCGKSVDLAYLASHPKISHVVGIDIVRNAAEDFASEHPDLLMEEIQLNECEVEIEEGQKCDNANDSANEISQSVKSTFRGTSLSFLIGDLFSFLTMNSIDRANILTEGMPSSAPTEYLVDAIYDRASMVAIKPSLRKDYVTLMGELLRPGGVILLVSLDRRKATTDAAKKDGPPFSINEAEIREIYESQPWVESVTLLDEVNDLSSDADRERWEKKGVFELYELVFLIRKKN